MIDHPVESVLLDDIYPDDEFNCRDDMSPMSVRELSLDIGQRGLLQPVVVMIFKPEQVKIYGRKYLLIAGYRRYNAIRMLQWSQIKATIHPWMPLAEALAFNLAENTQRSDLNILEEAKVLEKLRELGYRKESQILAMLPGKSRGWVQIRWMLISLPEDIQKECAAGLISQKGIRALYTVYNSAIYPSEEDREKAVYDAARQIKGSKASADTLTQRFGKRGEKKQKTKAQIEALMSNLFGQGLREGAWSKVLAWAAGNIRSDEMWDYLEAYGDIMKTPIIRNAGI